MSSDNITGIESDVHILGVSTIPNAGPGDATSGWGRTPIMQRNKAASLNIFLVTEQKEGAISCEDHGLAGRLDWLTTVLTTIYNNFSEGSQSQFWS